jgi:hypothetical protein
MGGQILSRMRLSCASVVTGKLATTIHGTPLAPSILLLNSASIATNGGSGAKKNPGEPLPKTPLSVSPTSIDLGKKEWKTNFVLKVYNKASDPYYQVYVKIRILSQEIELRDIEISSSSRDPTLKFDIGPVAVSTDAYQLRGLDEAGNKAIYLWLQNLDPSETRSFTIKNLHTGYLSDLYDHLAEINLVSFSTEPARILQQKEGIAFPLHLTENFRVASLSIVIGRKE